MRASDLPCDASGVACVHVATCGECNFGILRPKIVRACLTVAMRARTPLETVSCSVQRRQICSCMRASVSRSGQAYVQDDGHRMGVHACTAQ